MFERQCWNYGLLAALLAGVIWLVDDAMLTGQWIEVSASVWFWLAIALPIVHQGYGWAIWRAELYYGLISRWFGRERGFLYFSIGFMVLLLGRPASIGVLAIATLNTLPMNPAIARLLALTLFIPWVYLMYSVLRYFGLKRALGIDHFDPAYRTMPLVNRGIFRYTSNGMYIFGFFILWIPGLIFLSQAALLAALFSHLSIWVHYFCTELPDMRRIYGSG